MVAALRREARRRHGQSVGQTVGRGRSKIRPHEVQQRGRDVRPDEI